MRALISQNSLDETLSENLSPGNPLYSRLANGMFWSLCGSAVAQGMSLLATVPVARLLGAKGYGELGIIQSTLMTFVIVSGPSLGDTASKYLAELRNRDPERAGKVLGLTFITGFVVSALLGLVFYISAPYLAVRVLNAPQLSLSLQVAAVALFLKGLNGAQIGLLAGFEAFGKIASLNFWSGAVSLPLMIGGTWAWGVDGAVIALAVIALVTVIIAQRVVRDVIRRQGMVIRYRDSMHVWRVLPDFYLPTVLSGLITIPVVWAGNALLVNQPNGYVEMGIFNVANQWRAAVQFLPSVMALPVLPILANLYARNEMDDYRKALAVNLGLAFIGALVPGLVVTLASGWIMQAYGSGFSHGTRILAVLALTAVLSSTAAVLGTAISSVGKRWHATGLNFIWAIAFLVACWKLVRFGSTGLALAYMVSYLIHLLTCGVYALRVLPRMTTLRVSGHAP